MKLIAVEFMKDILKSQKEVSQLLLALLGTGTCTLYPWTDEESK